MIFCIWRKCSRYVIATSIGIFLLTLVFMNSVIHMTHRINRYTEIEPVYLHNRENFVANETEVVLNKTTVGRKTVLLWTDFYEGWEWFSDAQVREICPGLRNFSCTSTANQFESDKADAIVFYWPHVNTNNLPKTKLINQKWILVSYESPIHVNKQVAETLGPHVDWVVSYRLDSDIYSPYGLFIPKIQNGNYSSEINCLLSDFRDKKLVVWMVSSCDAFSNRQNFVKLMQEEISVDIFGLCGSKSFQCGTPRSRLECYGELAKKYKYYLSFENSICLDYATEKFFLPLAVGMIPVTLGGADYDKIAPNGSYINALDFESPQKLAQYLILVSNNATLYQSYFKWKEKYQLVFSDLTDLKSRFWICDLCAKLHREGDAVTRTKNTRDMTKWWFDEGNCRGWKTWKNIIRYLPNL